MNRYTIVGIGEALFDVLPDREVLGGAPLNVVVHAHQLGAARGVEALMVSRVGADERGRRLRDELAARGLSDEFLQTDRECPTGTVRIELDQGEPRYDIVRHVAWDRLAFTPELAALAERCHAVCYGTLAQREEPAHHAVCRFLQAAEGAVKLFDVNLRQGYYNEALLRRGLELATFAKMNEAELRAVAAAVGVARAAATAADETDLLAEALRQECQLAAVIVTKGRKGIALYAEDGQLDAPGVRVEAQPGADHVGAGDAASAALLVGMVLDWPPLNTLALANRLGAFVASVPGATPPLPPEILALVGA